MKTKVTLPKPGPKFPLFAQTSMGGEGVITVLFSHSTTGTVVAREGISDDDGRDNVQIGFHSWQWSEVTNKKWTILPPGTIVQIEAN